MKVHEGSLHSRHHSSSKVGSDVRLVWTRHSKRGPQHSMQFRVQANIKLGDRVIVQGKYPGVVRYIGDLDSSYTNDQIYVGVKVDDPVGESDGLFRGKRFFKCPPKHGLIVPVNQVAYIPIPGKNYEKRLKLHSPSKRCYEQRLLKQADRLVQIPPSRKQTDHVESSFRLVSKRSNYSADVPQLLMKMDPVDECSTSTVTANQSFKSTDVELSSDPATILKELSPPVMRIVYQKRRSKSQETSPDAHRNDDYVSLWMEHIQRIKNSPNSSKLFIDKEGQFRNNKQESKEVVDQKVEPIKPKTSYTRCLLSGLPTEYTATPDTKLRDVEEFSYWMDQWGGGIKGWKMAQARQKLKDAQRLGTRQIDWQRTIDELGNEEEFHLQVEKIKAMHEELQRIRSARLSIENDLLANGVLARHRVPSDKVVFDYLLQIEKEEQRIKELEISIAENPLSPMIDMSKLIEDLKIVQK